MDYYKVEPGVPATIGPRTIWDTSVHPPKLSNVELLFDWVGDCLIESFPVYAVSEEAAEKLVSNGCTGVQFESIICKKSEDFGVFKGDQALPVFRRLIPIGKPGFDDFGEIVELGLIISAKALNVLEAVALQDVIVSPYKPR